MHNKKYIKSAMFLYAKIDIFDFGMQKTLA